MDASLRVDRLASGLNRGSNDTSLTPQTRVASASKRKFCQLIGPFSIRADASREDLAGITFIDGYQLYKI